jgi:NitT/TauT family transport system substrate-binding protein
MMIARTNEAPEILHRDDYQQVPERDLKEQFGPERVFPTVVWWHLYHNGTVPKWVRQVSDFFVRFAKIETPVPATSYFDAGVLLSTVRR